jgi:hypothetical protein
MSEEISGGCLCGNIRYKISEQPKIQLLCHCKNCQRQTGSAFSASCLVKRENFDLQGTPKTYANRGDSGADILRNFCPDCGSALYFEVADTPGSVAVNAGTLDDTSWYKPRANFWTDSKQDWVTIDPECRNFAREPG